MTLPMVTLGTTGPSVHPLIFGTEHIIDRSAEEGGALLAEAFQRFGINHWDTAIAYKSHPQVAAGLTQVGREDIVVTSKSPAKTREEATTDLTRILEELQTDYIDILFLHNVRTGALSAHENALRYFQEAQTEGLIRHLGLSSHSPSVLQEASHLSSIEVVCGTLNRDGSRIDDGTLDDMRSALHRCHDAGKGVYVIKILGRGDLVDDVEGAISFVTQYRFIDAFNIGMKNREEVEENFEILTRCLQERKM